MTITKTTKVTRITKKEVRTDGTVIETIETTTEGMTPEEAKQVEAEFDKFGSDMDDAFKDAETQIDDAMKGVNDTLNNIGARLGNIRLGGFFNRKKPQK